MSSLFELYENPKMQKVNREDTNLFIAVVSALALVFSSVWLVFYYVFCLIVVTAAVNYCVELLHDLCDETLNANYLLKQRILMLEKERDELVIENQKLMETL
jgi:hypothetical protein